MKLGNRGIEGVGGVMITIMLTVIIAMVGLSIAWTTIRAKLDQTTVTDDQFTPNNSTCVQVTEDCIASVTNVENATNTKTWGVGNYSTCNADSSGVSHKNGILFDGGISEDAEINGVSNGLNVTYTNEDCTRLTGITGTVVSYIPMMMAVLLLIFVAAYTGLKG